MDQLSNDSHLPKSYHNLTIRRIIYHKTHLYLIIIHINEATFNVHPYRIPYEILSLLFYYFATNMITNLGIPFIFNPENYYNKDLIRTHTRKTSKK